MYDIGSFYQARDVADAVRALADDPASMVISGGTDVLIGVRAGKHTGARLVSIHGLPELTGVRREADGTLVLGPCTVFSALEGDPLVREHIPILAEAAGQVGGPQVRNMGTVGGNIANGATSADTAPALLCLNTVLELTGPNGVRRVPLREFYTGPGRTVRARDEVLTALRIAPTDYEGFTGCYIKYGKRAAMEISTLGCAALLRRDGERIEELRLAFGVAAPTPVRCPKAEARAAGAVWSPDLADALAQAALDETAPRSSWRASKEFRQRLIAELTRRAVGTAWARAEGGTVCSRS